MPRSLASAIGSRIPRTSVPLASLLTSITALRRSFSLHFHFSVPYDTYGSRPVHYPSCLLRTKLGAQCLAITGRMLAKYMNLDTITYKLLDVALPWDFVTNHSGSGSFTC